MGLRELPTPLRYAAYATGALLVFFAAVGMGAAASLVVGWQAEQAEAGSSGSTTAGMPEGTSATMPAADSASEGTAIETDDFGAESTDPETSEAPPEKTTSFRHTATDGNSRGDYTILSDPRINGDPAAVVLVVPVPDRGHSANEAYDHNIGVWYEPGAQKWAIFNQDLAAMPAGASFEVVVPQADEGFVHRAKPANTVGGTTYLDHPLTNGEPGIVLLVTQNWNPEGGAGVYNDHSVGVLYDEDVDRWAVYNRDGARIPDGAAFNLAVSGSEQSAR